MRADCCYWKVNECVRIVTQCDAVSKIFCMKKIDHRSVELLRSMTRVEALEETCALPFT